jgi:hypothetical protein
MVTIGIKQFLDGKYVDRLQTELRGRPFRCSVIFSGVLFAATLLTFSLYFETNDDAGMNLIAAGLAFGDRPDEHLVFTNVVIGLPLKWLYQSAPHIPWYGMYQIVTLFSAVCALIYCLFRVNPGLAGVGIVVLIFVEVVFPCLIAIQFTKTAFLAALAGSLLLLAPLRGVEPWPRFANVAGVILIVFGSLIRAESLVLTCVMVFPIAVMAAYRYRLRALRPALLFVSGLLLAAVLYFFNRAYYARDEGWKDIYAFNAVRAEFTDYGHYVGSGRAGRAFEALGWQPVDLQMLLSWFYADPQRYSLARLREVIDKVPAEPVPSVDRVALNLIGQIATDSPPLLRLVIAGICLAILTGAGWQRILLPATLFGVAFVTAVALGTWYYLIPRIAFSLLVGVILGTATRPVSPIRARWGSRPFWCDVALRAIAAVTAVVVMVLSFRATWQSDAVRQEKRSSSQTILRELGPRPDQLYVVWAEWFPYPFLVRPLNDLEDLRPFRCVAMSWLIPTPFTKRRLEEFHIHDVYRAIWERPDVYLVAGPGLLPVFKYYVQVHYHTKLDFHTTYELSTFSVFQARPHESSGPGTQR